MLVKEATGGCCNIGYPPDTLTLLSHEISFAQVIHFSCQIILKICSEWYFRALYNISNQFVNRWLRYGQTRFHEISFEDEFRMDILLCDTHDDVIKWKYFPRYWPFVHGIHQSPVNSPLKGQWRGTLMFSLICDRINCWVNNCEAGNLRRHRVHYDVIGMLKFLAPDVNLIIMLTICRVSGLYPKRWPTNFQDIEVESKSDAIINQSNYSPYWLCYPFLIGKRIYSANEQQEEILYIGCIFSIFRKWLFRKRHMRTGNSF